MRKLSFLLPAALLLAFSAQAMKKTAPKQQAPESPTLYPKLERDTTNGFNHFLAELLVEGTKAGWTHEPKSKHDEDEAVKYIQGKMGGGGGDHGNAIRQAVREHVEFANKRHYDITNTAVLKGLHSVIVAIVSDGYTTQMGNFRGQWNGGGFH